MSRQAIPPTIAARILLLSRRRCALCFGLDRDSSEKRGQIAHLNRDRSDSRPENLCYLCLDHHDRYDSKTSQSRAYTAPEVARYRDELYQYISAVESADTIPSPTMCETHSTVSSQPEASSQAQSARTILVVDDDFDIIRSLFRPLENEGFTIVPARSVSEALHEIYSATPISLLICDLILPYGLEMLGEGEYTGLDVIRRARRVRPDLPILVLSIVTRTEVFAELSALAIHIATKPIRPSELKALAAAALSSPSPSQQAVLLRAEVERCMSELAAESPETRVRAAWALGELAHRVAVDQAALLSALSREINPTVSRAIAQALARTQEARESTP